MLTDHLVAEEWDYTRNKIDINTVTESCTKKVWWKCSNHKHHYWQANVSSRTKGSGCPVCRGLAICPVDQCNSLKFLHQNLVETEWDYERNTIQPDTITPGSNKKVWWKCKEDHHVYELVINNKIKQKRSCAVCAGKQICPIDQCNSAGKKYRKVCQEWHPTKNVKSPLEYTGHSSQKVWWQCKKCDYEWQTQIDSRTRLNRGCPECKKSM